MADSHGADANPQIRRVGRQAVPVTEIQTAKNLLHKLYEKLQYFEQRERRLEYLRQQISKDIEELKQIDDEIHAIRTTIKLSRPL